MPPSNPPEDSCRGLSSLLLEHKLLQAITACSPLEEFLLHRSMINQDLLNYLSCGYKKVIIKSGCEEKNLDSC